MSTKPPTASRPRRPHRTAAQWSQLVDEWSRSGMSADAFAKVRDVPRSSFHLWRLKLRGPARESRERREPPVSMRMVPVRVTPTSDRSPRAQPTHATTSRSDACWELINADGRILRVHGDLAHDSISNAIVAMTTTRNRSRRSR